MASVVAGSNGAGATEMTAGVVAERMSAGERAAYLASIIEGLAHARHVRDGKETAGRSCIYG